MVIYRFRNNEEHEELLKRVKRMKRFAEEIEDCLKECMEEADYDFRGKGSYRKDYEDDEFYKRDSDSRYARMGRRGER